MFGSVDELADGRWRLRFTRTLAHPVETVWRAITEPEHLAAWFPTTIEGPREAGAQLRFAFPEDRWPPVEGEVLTYEPMAVFEFRWGTDIIRLELEASGDGTVLTLLDTIEQRGKAARDAAGWHGCLDALADSLAGRPEARSSMGRWDEVHAHYVERFGPEGATIGPPEGAS